MQATGILYIGRSRQPDRDGDTRGLGEAARYAAWRHNPGGRRFELSDVDANIELTHS